MITKICKNCGKEFQTDDGRTIFCSRSCANQFNRIGKKHTYEERLKISQTLQKKNPHFDGTFHDVKNPIDTYTCLNCGKQLNVRYASEERKYCSCKCQGEYEYKKYIKRWQNGEESGVIGKYSLSNRIRKYLFAKVQNKCEECGFEGANPYTNRSILQIHHIDGNCLNNTEANLQVLCPNCHAMTENFGNRNKNATPGRSRRFGRAN